MSSSKDNHLWRSANETMIYQIRIKGNLDCRWTYWFEGLIITLGKDGNTFLTGPVADQAALHGILKKVRDLGLFLISVTNMGYGPAKKVDKKGSCFESSI